MTSMKYAMLVSLNGSCYPARRTLEFSRAELRRLKAHALLNFCPAQTMITDLCFVFQKWILADCKAGD
jgi:hypothetical protein